MAYADLEEARRHHAALKSLIERHAGVSGVDFLKQQALNALELFQSRVYSLESMRRAAARGVPALFALIPRRA